MSPDWCNLYHMIRLMARNAQLLALLAVTLLMGCTAGKPTSSREVDSSCAHTTAGSATSGVIQAGPFGADLTRYFLQLPDGGKFWVGSTSSGSRQGASIVASFRDDPQITVRQERPATPVSTVEGLAQFYPGMLRLPRSGTWSVHVLIGTDSGCFEFDVGH